MTKLPGKLLLFVSVFVMMLFQGCGGAQGGASEPPPEEDPSADEIAEHYMGQAGLALSDGDMQGALEYYLEAASVYDNSGQVTVERAEAHFLAASIAYDMGERIQAIEEYDASVQIYLRFKGNSKIKAANALNNMGAIYKELEKKGKARDCWEDALQIYKSAPAKYRSKSNMAKIQQNLRDLAEGF